MNPLRDSARRNATAEGDGPGEGTPQFERWEYGNPEDVFARREAKSCNGCRHEEKIRLGGGPRDSPPVKYCGKGRKHGKRCQAYQPKGA
jgi:hypothetical protein